MNKKAEFTPAEIIIITFMMFAFFGVLTSVVKLIINHPPEILLISESEEELVRYTPLEWSSYDIKYSILNCSDIREENIYSALQILENKTDYTFSQTVLREVEEKNHIYFKCVGELKDRRKSVVGTALTHYTYDLETGRELIDGGEIRFENGYIADDCDYPSMELHEILHIFGFDHVNNSKSIMYPVTGCSEIDKEIVHILNGGEA